MKKRLNIKGFGHIEMLLSLSIVAVIGVIGVYVAKTRSNQVFASPGLPPNAILMDGQPWMISDDDLAVIGNMGSYQWVSCGLTTVSCKPGQDPIYTSEATFASDIASNKLVSGTTVVYDNEIWSATPVVERQNPVKYEDLTVQQAKANNIYIIATPYAPLESDMINEEVADAKAGANVVEIQAQTRDKDPTKYKALVNKAVKAIRAVNPNVIILAGLATDNGGIPATSQSLYKDYQDVKGVVNGFWLNAHIWEFGKGCSPQGCPTIARDFLNEIGVPFTKI